jgi:hypothetical protein
MNAGTGRKTEGTGAYDPAGDPFRVRNAERYGQQG